MSALIRTFRGDQVFYDVPADDNTWRENAEILAEEANTEKLFEVHMTWALASICARFGLGMDWPMEGRIG